MDQCVLTTMTYGCQTWSLNKQLTNKLRTAQRAMERKMLDLKLQDKVQCSEIRRRTKITDIIENTLKQKGRWAGHIARMKDNRWTKSCTERQPRRGKRSRRRPSRSWQDDVTRTEGTTWIRKATGRRQWKTTSCSGWTKPRRRRRQRRSKLWKQDGLVMCIASKRTRRASAQTIFIHNTYMTFFAIICFQSFSQFIPL